MEYSNEVLAHRLKVQRTESKFSQEQLAEASGVKKNSIARYEMGGTTPGLDAAFAMAQALNCSIDDLCGLPKPELRKEAG